MPGTRKIFVGSSREALEVAKRVKEVIENWDDMTLTADLWNTNAFPSGQTLVETIESIPFEYDGAVLLWTPDVASKRGASRKVNEPVANVVFEYGYLAARLTRRRVAICRFQDAEVPSDLQGVKLIQVENYEKTNPPPLPETASRDLSDWLKQLPLLTAGLPPISQVHGYSGIWSVQNQFSLWRGHQVGESDQIYFDGKTFLVIKTDGGGGSGIQVGHLYIFVGNYAATYEILNEILQATVDKEGTLRLHVKVIRCQRIEEHGEPPSARFRTELANKEFDLVLARGRENMMTLEGKHEYKRARTNYQVADETYEYHGLFNPPSL